MPSLTLPVYGAALATPQLQPAHMGYNASDYAMSLPTRAAEPWSVESWFVSTGTSQRATLFMQGPQMYATTPSIASGGHRDGFSVTSGIF